MNNFSISEFDYYLPLNQIAYKPLLKRDNSKLMYLDTTSKTFKDKKFSDITDFIKKGDLVILNNTKVIPGRMFLRKETGGRVEILFHRLISSNSFEAIFTSSKPLKLNSKLFYDDKNYFTIKSINKNYMTLCQELDKPVMNIFKNLGIIPLPKYIKRMTSSTDKERYQTIYAREEGSVAAPTAGLHFTQEIINKLISKGVNIEYLTLHITYNTFKPITKSNYTQHNIGKEFFIINKPLLNSINMTKKKGNRVIAIGTTVVRAIEYCFSKNISDAFNGYVDLFIYPGYKFKIIDSLLTNFHLPKSSLLLLVCAFAGKNRVLSAYNDAVFKNYRFYSYGDCMFINKS